MINSRFSGPVKCEWLEHSRRKVKLLGSLSFCDKNGKIWTAPDGAVVDGASIPKFFWRVVGPPFVGLYRRASVIHDWYCISKSEPYTAVHKVFDEMMITDGVPDFKRKMMAYAVKQFGPKW